MSILRNVVFRLYTNEETDEHIDTPLFERIDKAEFLEKLKNKELKMPEVKEWQTLALIFTSDQSEGAEVKIWLVSKAEDRWYEYETDAPIVLYSIEEERSMVIDYTYESQTRRSRNNELTQEEYIKQQKQKWQLFKGQPN